MTPATIVSTDSASAVPDATADTPPPVLHALAAGLSPEERWAALSAADLPSGRCQSVTADQAAALVVQGAERLGYQRMRKLAHEMDTAQREHAHLLRLISDVEKASDSDSSILTGLREAKDAAWRERSRLWQGAARERVATNAAYAFNLSLTQRAAADADEPVYHVVSGPATDLSDLDTPIRPQEDGDQDADTA